MKFLKVESEMYFDIVGLNNNKFLTQATETSSLDLLKFDSSWLEEPNAQRLVDDSADFSTTREGQD